MNYHKSIAGALADAADFYADGKHLGHLILAATAIHMVHSGAVDASSRGFVEGALRIFRDDAHGKQDITGAGDANDAMRLHETLRNLPAQVAA